MTTYRMPAEWEPHAATWLAWPHNRRDWPGKFAAIPWAYGEIVRHLAESEPVRIIVGGPAHERAARRVLQKAAPQALARVEFFVAATDRSWTRDTGPIFVRDEQGELVVADFRFNAWAKYADFANDERLAARLAKRLGLASFRPQLAGKRFVLEGGAIDVNGCGTLLTTRQVMLDNTQQPRNPHFSQAQIETLLGQSLGATNIFYLNEGIAGDDTGGHVDDLCRFVDRRTVVVVSTSDERDANFAALRDARDRLADLRLEDGRPAEVIALPSPAPLYCGDARLPASYANFYIGNRVVLVPTFNDPADRAALGLLGELFPTRKVVGIHAVDLVWGFGTLHCLTQQQPATE